MNEYRNKLVKKPWGFEYIVYESPDIAIWFLTIYTNQQTSLHCHPSKKTGLIVLDGRAELSFLNSSLILLDGEKCIIRNGMFHSTKNVGDKELSLLEIETPNNKGDIIRLMDNYGRAGQPYEKDSIDFLTRQIPMRIGDYNTHIINISTIDDIHNLKDDDQIMGIMPIVVFSGHEVMGKADIVSKSTLLRLASQFGVQSCQAILIRKV